MPFNLKNITVILEQVRVNMCISEKMQNFQILMFTMIDTLSKTQMSISAMLCSAFTGHINNLVQIISFVFRENNTKNYFYCLKFLLLSSLVIVEIGLIASI